MPRLAPRRRLVSAVLLAVPAVLAVTAPALAKVADDQGVSPNGTGWPEVVRFLEREAPRLPIYWPSPLVRGRGQTVAGYVVNVYATDKDPARCPGGVVEGFVQYTSADAAKPRGAVNVFNAAGDRTAAGHGFCSGALAGREPGAKVKVTLRYRGSGGRTRSIKVAGRFWSPTASRCDLELTPKFAHVLIGVTDVAQPCKVATAFARRLRVIATVGR